MRLQGWFYLTCLYSLLSGQSNNLSPQSLIWDGISQPQKHSLHLEPDKKFTLEILLGDAPVVTLHHRLPKYQIFKVDRLIEFTDWSLLGYNTQRQIHRFSADQLTFHDGFHSRTGSQFEFNFKEGLTFDQCYIYCGALRAEMIFSQDQLEEVLALVPRFKGHRWLNINQNSLPKYIPGALFIGSTGKSHEPHIIDGRIEPQCYKIHN